MSVEVIDKIKPKNNGDFAIVEAKDVEMPDGSRLSDQDFSGGLPKVSETDEGKIFSVVGGKLVLVPVADSSVKTYVDEYINSALEGEY